MENNERETYEIFFYKMVSKVADDFSVDECQKLCFIFQKQISQSFSEKHSQNPLKLLNYLMQEKKLFSADKPDKLAKLMEILDFPNKKNTVEAFIDDYRGIISALYPSRALPPLPTKTTSYNPIEEEGDDMYMTMESVQGSYQQNDQCARCSSTAEATVCQPSSVNYVAFHPPSQHSQKQCSKQVSSSSDQSSSEEYESGVYSEPYSNILVGTSREYFPLLEEHIKLLVNPVKDTITRGKQQVVMSYSFSCPLPKCNFILEVDPGSNSCISAKLYLQAGHRVENSPPSYYYLAELQVQQDSKKCKHSQNIYSHTELLDFSLLEPHKPKAHLTERPSPSSSQEENQTLPDSLMEEQEQHRHIPAECNDKDDGRTGSHVASFPTIISHRNFMDEKLVKEPQLTLIFTLKQYRHEE